MEASRLGSKVPMPQGHAPRNAMEASRIHSKVSLPDSMVFLCHTARASSQKRHGSFETSFKWEACLIPWRFLLYAARASSKKRRRSFKESIVPRKACLIAEEDRRSRRLRSFFLEPPS
jgi:hypothetical protein